MNSANAKFTALIFKLLLSLMMLRCGESSMLSETVDLANYVGNRLFEIAEEATGRQHFDQAFSEMQKANETRVEKADGLKLVKEFAATLEKEVASKNTVLLKVKEKAEEYHNPKFDVNIKPFPFFNMKDYNYSGRPLLVKDPKFFSSKQVNTSMSGHHVPTNVYEFNYEVLNVIKERQKLDPLYEESYKKQSTLLWQYIGSPSGVLSMYPAYLWDNPQTDRYDCRRRGWYTAGASSAKDVVILLDRSGSMSGTNSKIATAAITTIIESLQENDFFNIVSFNTNANVVNSCYNNLVQASKSNREQILGKMRTLPNPNGYANGMKALEKAYQLLKEAGKSELTSSGCHKVIFLLSDEIEDFQDMKKIIEKYADMKVRIFSYQIGRRQKNREAMNYIACKTLGKFYKLETIGSAYDFVLDYVKVLGTPIALNHRNTTRIPLYVPVYIDWETKLPVFSVVLPVIGSSSQQQVTSLLGVATQDITLIELQNTVPVHKLGVNGYGFSTNNNGFIHFHRRLRWQKDPSTFAPTPLLSAVERNLNNQSEVLIREMVDRKTGNLTTNSIQMASDEKRERLIFSKLNYFYTPVSNTPFTAGICMQEFGINQIFLGSNFSLNYSDAVRSLNSSTFGTFITVSPWPYCNISAKAQINTPTIYKFYPNKQELVEHLSQFNKTPSNCNQELTESLLLSAVKVDDIVKKHWNVSTSLINNVVSTFVSTHAGLTRINFPGGNTTYGNVGNKSISEIFYLRAAALYNETKLQYIFTRKDSNETTLMAVTPIVVGNEKAVAAVVGFTIMQTAVAKMMKSSRPNKSLQCNSYSSTGCYILDSDGYILAWNSENKLSTNFFGMHEGLVMRRLIDEKIFVKHKLKDQQAECTPEYTATGSASRIGNAIFGCICCLIQATFTIFSSAIRSALFTRNDFTAAQTTSTKNVNCVKEMVFYKLDETKLPYEGHTKDYVCSKNFTLAKLPYTNLVLVTTDRRNTACNKKDWKLTRDPVKLPETCENKYIYRRQIKNSCSRYNSEEKQHCSSSAISLQIFHSTLIAMIGTAYYLTL